MSEGAAYNPNAAFLKCQHFNVEEIKNGFDKVIGGQCSTCLEVVWGLGQCYGCKQPNQKLTILVGGASGSRRYCNEECKKLAIKYKRENGK